MIKDNLGISETIAYRVSKGIIDEIRMTGFVEAWLRDSEGRLKAYQKSPNTVTSAAKAGAADQILAAPTLAKVGWMAVGTGSPAATLLGAEVARVALTSKLRAANVVTMIGDFPAGTGTGALTEAGLFDIVTANTVNMWNSTTLVFTKGALDVLSISWTLTWN